MAFFFFISFFLIGPSLFLWLSADVRLIQLAGMVLPIIETIGLGKKETLISLSGLFFYLDTPRIPKSLAYYKLFKYPHISL